jgi:AcrR family transcriptional regulator
MAQVPKQHVRDRFVAAAAASFAEAGYEATTMAGVAERAGSSVGNLYKYFSSKQELLDAAIPPELVRELGQRTRARMLALGRATDVAQLAPSAPYHALAGELLDFCFEHRAAVVVLLSRAQGTRHAAFATEFVEQLVAWSLEYARLPYPALRPTPELQFVLRRAYQSFVASVATALHEFTDETRARGVIALLTSAHQGGLKRLFETQGETDAQPCHPAPSPVVETAAGPRARGTGAGGAGPSAAGGAARQADRPRRSRRRR